MKEKYIFKLRFGNRKHICRRFVAKHQLNNLFFKYQVCQMKLRHLNTFLQFWLLFHEPHCICKRFVVKIASQIKDAFPLMKKKIFSVWRRSLQCCSPTSRAMKTFTTLGISIPTPST